MINLIINENASIGTQFVFLTCGAGNLTFVEVLD